MKLTSIKDIRVGQVWESHNNLYVVETAERFIKEPISCARVAMYERGKKCLKGIVYSNNFCNGKKLVGKIGITHEIDGDFIIEIKRSKNIRVDDVVKFNWNDPRLYVINREIDFGIKEKHPDNSCFEGTNDIYGSRQLVDFELKRVGILGVTHEFVNNEEPE